MSLAQPPPAEHQRSTGALPAGASTEAEASVGVQRMFNVIAPRYDLLNHTLSIGLDRLWWSRTARAFRPELSRPEALVVDLCCGTGDMTLALLKHRPASATRSPILAIDFSHAMLLRGAAKFPAHGVLAVEADALHLPIASATVDLLVSAFGFRNLANYEHGLAEIHRVLKPGAKLGILDCNQPAGLSGALYNLYFQHIPPLFGGLISGDRQAYRYLPASVSRFPRPPRMLQLIRQAGFVDASWKGYTLGTAGLYRATKP